MLLMLPAMLLQTEDCGASINRVFARFVHFVGPFEYAGGESRREEPVERALWVGASAPRDRCVTRCLRTCEQGTYQHFVNSRNQV